MPDARPTYPKDAGSWIEAIGFMLAYFFLLVAGIVLMAVCGGLGF